MYMCFFKALYRCVELCNVLVKVNLRAQQTTKNLLGKTERKGQNTNEPIKKDRASAPSQDHFREHYVHVLTKVEFIQSFCIDF